MTADHREQYIDDLIESGFSQYVKGQLSGAEVIYTTTLVVIRKMKLEAYVGAAKVFFLLGDLYADRMNYKRSEHFYRHSLAEYETLPGDHMVDVCVVLRRISEVCTLQEKKRQACNMDLRAKRLLHTRRKLLEELFGRETEQNSREIDQKEKP